MDDWMIHEKLKEARYNLKLKLRRANWPQKGVLVGILHLKERHKMSTFGISCVISKTHLKYYQGTYHSLGFREYDMWHLDKGEIHNFSPSPFIDVRGLGVHLWTFQLPVERGPWYFPRTNLNSNLSLLKYPYIPERLKFELKSTWICILDGFCCDYHPFLGSI